MTAAVDAATIKAGAAKPGVGEATNRSPPSEGSPVSIMMPGGDHFAFGWGSDAGPRVLQGAALPYQFTFLYNADAQTIGLKPR